MLQNKNSLFVERTPKLLIKKADIPQRNIGLSSNNCALFKKRFQLVQLILHVAFGFFFLFLRSG